MKVSIIGAGTVGYAVGKGLDRKGHSVLFYDIDEKRLEEIKDNGYKATHELEDILKSDVSFLCVPTPNENGKQDLGNLKSAVKNLGQSLRKKEEYHLVSVKSTVLPGTTEEKVIPWLEKYSGKKAGRKLGVCMNPEFLTQDSALEDFLNPDRIVIGEYDKKSGDLLEELYQPFDAPIYRTGLKEAELTKYIANNFLATKISYFNLAFLIGKELGINGKKVAKIVGEDPRIGKYGTLAGKAFNGHCLPKDLKAFNNFLKEELPKKEEFFSLIRRINKKMKEKYGVYEESGISEE